MAYFLLSTLSISTMLQGIYQAFYKVPKKIVTRYKVRWPSTWLQLLPQPVSCITLMVLDGEIRRKHRQIKKVIPQNELKTDSEKENHVPLLSLIKEQWWKPSHVKKYYILFQHSSYTKPPRLFLLHLAVTVLFQGFDMTDRRTESISFHRKQATPSLTLCFVSFC